MNRKRKTRQIRKNLMRMGQITWVKVLNRDDDGKIYPKREWGYCVKISVNGYSITGADDSWYDAYKGALEAAKWAAEQTEYM